MDLVSQLPSGGDDNGFDLMLQECGFLVDGKELLEDRNDKG